MTTRKITARKTVHQPGSSPVVRRNSVTPTILWSVLIIAAGFLAYANCFRGEFVMDDYEAIVNNDVIRQLFPLKPFIRDTRPVTDYTFALNYAIWDLNRSALHAVNLAIHLANALLLFGVVRRTLVSPRVSQPIVTADRLAFAVALLWVVHPLTTQSVTYLVQRGEALMSFFYLMVLYSLIRGSRSQRHVIWYGLGVIACALGMGAKAVMVTAPLLALLYDRMFISSSLKGIFRARWPFYAALACTPVVLWFVGVIGGLYLKEQGGPITVGFAMKGITPVQYGLTQLGVITHYLRLAIWPHPLVIDYGWPIASGMRAVFPSAILITAILGLMIWMFYRGYAAAFLIAAFLIILAPTSSIVPIRDVAFEHRMYLPLAAIIALITLVVYRLITRLAHRIPKVKRITPAILIIVSTGLASVTYARNRDYADPLKLWTENISLTPWNPRPRNALGFALFKSGRPAEAEARYREVLQIEPYNANAYANLGHLYVSQRRLTDAIASYERALQISPDEFGADFFAPYGAALLECGRVDEAIQKLKTAVQFEPNYVEARYNLANALMKRGDLQGAVKEYEEVLKRTPGFAEAAVNLGLARMRMGNYAGALEAYERALPVAGSSDSRFKAHYNMALALIRLGKNPQARLHLEQALQIRPQDQGAQAALQTLQSSGARNGPSG